MKDKTLRSTQKFSSRSFSCYQSDSKSNIFFFSVINEILNFSSRAQRNVFRCRYSAHGIQVSTERTDLRIPLFQYYVIFAKDALSIHLSESYSCPRSHIRFDYKLPAKGIAFFDFRLHKKTFIWGCCPREFSIHNFVDNRNLNREHKISDLYCMCQDVSII